MSVFTYSAMDCKGKTMQGTLQVASQSEALQRLKEMGFFPTKVSEIASPSPAERAERHAARLGLKSGRFKARPSVSTLSRGGLKTRHLTTFTRQLATLLDAGMPLLRGLRLLEEQEAQPRLKQVIAAMSDSIEAGSSLSEGLEQHPKIFDRLFVNLIRAGELGGTIESSLQRLADFMEKSEKLKRQVKAAMFYPAAVLVVALGVVALLMLYVIPKFQEVFQALMNGHSMPPFTLFVLAISDAIRSHFVGTFLTLVAMAVGFRASLRTQAGRRAFDRFKLAAPVFGPVARKIAIARFSRTLGTMVTSGVPILQALNIVKESTGNVLMNQLVGKVHDHVKQGESIVGPLRQSRIFPVLVAGMVDVGEQTGALPEMLNKIADNYDEEVETSVAAMTSLLEPIMIVFLAVLVGSIVIAMFLPLIDMMNNLGQAGGSGVGPGE